MAELVRVPEIGLNTRDIKIDRQTGEIHKLVTRLPDLEGAFALPTRDGYRRLVGKSIDLLTDKRWGFAEMIPRCSLRIIESERMTGGCECWLDMDFIEGQKLSQMENIPKSVADQLEAFLNGCVTMAKTTRKEFKRIVIPDLLGGVLKPHNKFRNFIVEDSTNKLYFVDVYPLARFGRRKLSSRKMRYKHCLTQAAQSIGHPGVVAAVERLKTVL